jgi:hypothetical protein
MFYTFIQNNSGGYFIRNDHLDHYVIIEASSLHEAVDRARATGIYFNGTLDGVDCRCCGDRWVVTRDWDIHEVPQLGRVALDVSTATTERKWWVNSVVIQYVDGRVLYMPWVGGLGADLALNDEPENVA